LATVIRLGIHTIRLQETILLLLKNHRTPKVKLKTPSTSFHIYPSMGSFMNLMDCKKDLLHLAHALMKIGFNLLENKSKNELRSIREQKSDLT